MKPIAAILALVALTTAQQLPDSPPAAPQQPSDLSPAQQPSDPLPQQPSDPAADPSPQQPADPAADLSPQQPSDPSPRQPATDSPSAASGQGDAQHPPSAAAAGDSPQGSSPQQPDDQGQGQGQGQGQDDHNALRLRCQSENGTVPYWLDATCQSYLSCTNFDLSMRTCEPGLVYSYPQRSCVLPDLLNCSLQNEEFSAIIRSFLAPHFYQNLPRPDLPLRPFAANNGPAFAGQPAVEEEEEDDEDGMTIDLDDLPSILVDTTNSLNITLAAETCARMDNNTRQLELSMNTALLMILGCPQESCDVQLFHLDC